MSHNDQAMYAIGTIVAANGQMVARVSGWAGPGHASGPVVESAPRLR